MSTVKKRSRYQEKKRGAPRQGMTRVVWCPRCFCKHCICSVHAVDAMKREIARERDRGEDIYNPAHRARELAFDDLSRRVIDDALEPTG